MTMEVDNNAKGDAELTEAENELYDRQIRLWGLESQKKLRTANVLIAGLCGLGAEVTKNIILSGVNSVKLLDSNVVTEEDFCSQFLAPRSSLGTNRAEASIDKAKILNKNVTVEADTEPLTQKDEEFFGKFDVVVIIGAPKSELLRIDEICRKKNVKFFAGDLWGTFGFCFADLQEYTFVEDVVKQHVISKPGEKIKYEKVTTTEERQLQFPPYSLALQFDINTPAYAKKLKHTGPGLLLLKVLQKFRETFNRDPLYKQRDADIAELEKIQKDLFVAPKDLHIYYENIFAQISPAAAVLGGVLAQEVIKVVTKNGRPHHNVFFFDPEESCGYIDTIGAEFN